MAINKEVNQGQPFIDLPEESLIPAFIKALAEEIEALKKGKGGNISKVFNGRFIGKSADYYLYTFQLENFLAAADDTPAEVEIGGVKHQGQITSVRGLEIDIALEKYVGDFIDEARIQTNLWYLLEILKKKYEESNPKDNKFAISEKLFRGANSEVVSSSTPGYSFDETTPPNSSQQNAITASFNNQFTVIWGPPGTGKTKTIAKAIEAHLNEGRCILLASHANTAVDEALEDIAEQLEDTTFYQEGKLLRLGLTTSEKLNKNYPLVILENVVAMKGEALAQEKQKILDKIERITQFLDSFKEIDDAIGIVNKSKEKQKKLSVKLSINEKNYAKKSLELDVLNEKKQATYDKWVKAKESGTLKRFVFGLDPEKIEKELHRLNAALQVKKLEFSTLKDEISSLQTELTAVEKEIKDFNELVYSLLAKHNLTLDSLKGKKETAEAERDTLNSRVAEINRELQEIQKKVLTEAVLVATTLTKTYISKQFPEKPFDTVIIDESSMAPLPHLYWAVSRATSFVTVIGDFYQLPPICVSDDEKAKDWLGRSIFDILKINTVQAALKDKRVSLLDTQYRMNPVIAEIPNRLFYEGNLNSHYSTEGYILNEDISGEAPLVLVNTSEINPWCSQPSSGSRFNIYNALIAIEIVKKLKPHNLKKVGILTPYKAQARLISRIAKDEGLTDFVRIDTVHSFQGGEEEVIIFDSVESPGLPNRFTMLDEHKWPDARLLLNVALTRAKKKMYLIAHNAHLRSIINKKSAIYRILELFEQNGVQIGSEGILEGHFDRDFEKYAAKVIEGRRISSDLLKSSPYNEKTFWPGFFDDLSNVRERLLIMSPFISLNRAGQMMDFFRALAKRNVELRIITRPPSEQGGNLSEHAKIVIKQLKDIGVTVIQRKRMHQKIAIMDNSVTWEGSLNILSHNNSQEQMRRFEGAKTVEEVIKNLGIYDEENKDTVTEEICPKCERGNLVIKKSRYGLFYGCSRYPNCDFTRDISKKRTKNKA